MIHTIKLGLDWWPNTVHCGIFIALAKDWYQDAGIKLEIISPEEDDYLSDNLSKVIDNQVDIAIGPSEYILEAKQMQQDIIPLGCLWQNLPHGIAVHKHSGIVNFAQLTGKRYASLDLPFEANILRKAVENQGGSYTPMFLSFPKLETIIMLEKGNVDAAWLFKTVEGIDAASRGIDLLFLSLEEAGVPYGPSCTLLTKSSFKETHPVLVHSFLQITERGYRWSINHPEEAAQLLVQHFPGKGFNNEKLVSDCIKASAPYLFDDEGSWGAFNKEQFARFKRFLIEIDALVLE